EQTAELIDGPELSARNQRHHQLDRPTNAGPLEIDAIRLAAVYVTPLKDTENGAAFIAVDGDQPVAGLEASGRRTPFVHRRHVGPAGVVTVVPPAILHQPVVADGRVDRKDEEARVHAARRQDKPGERRAALVGHEASVQRRIPQSLSRIPARLGPYEIVSPLGAGGMGEVYRAHDTKLGRDVALKVLPDSLASDPERLARFEREAHLLATLNHPHIAHIYGVEDST